MHHGPECSFTLFLFPEIVSKPYFDDEDLPASETDSEDEVVLMRTDRDWKAVDQE